MLSIRFCRASLRGICRGSCDPGTRPYKFVKTTPPVPACGTSLARALLALIKRQQSQKPRKDAPSKATRGLSKACS